MYEKDNLDALIQNLEDAECTDEIVKKFIKYQEQGQISQQVCILIQHRKQLLENMHECQRKLDCLDYLIYQLKLQSQKMQESTKDQNHIGEMK